jgi:hypothetical protein
MTSHTLGSTRVAKLSRAIIGMHLEYIDKEREVRINVRRERERER